MWVVGQFLCGVHKLVEPVTQRAYVTLDKVTPSLPTQTYVHVLALDHGSLELGDIDISLSSEIQPTEEVLQSLLSILSKKGPLYALKSFHGRQKRY